ncbi:hypothetical protein [Empedobacter falsenii]|uniref:Lipoprotein n=1 Tax=Empedobacter falsenii TaxID=343874 RepID=A0AAW7DP62_9FLAO|nr:hypothetical protein [Empedobacter falsenii]MDM1552692.1 hypothetical protein [Empedobacter falsenii]
MKTVIGFGVVVPFVLFLIGCVALNSFFNAERFESTSIYYLTLFAGVVPVFISSREIILKCRPVKITSNCEVFVCNKSLGKIIEVSETTQSSKLGFEKVLVIKLQNKTIKLAQFYYFNYSKIKEYLKEELSIKIINEL